MSRPRRVPGQPRPRSGRGRARDPGRAKPEFPPAGALRALVEGSDEGMILADHQAVILYANDACHELLGQSPAELRGRVGFDMVHPAHIEVARAAFGRCLSAPSEPVDLVLAIVHADGSTPTITVRLLNRLNDPAIGAVVVHFRRAAKVSRPSEEHYRAVFESAPVGLGVADMNGQLLIFNDAMMRPGGYSREDILAIGNVARLYHHERDRERVLAVAREQGFVWRFEVQFRRKNGEPYDTLLTLAPVRFDGRPCWLAAVEDITEQKRAQAEQRRLEAKLQQAQKMEAVGRMTAGIAHDFNNVLTVILGSSQILATTSDEPPGSHQVEINELRRAAQLGSAMVRKLLGYSRSAPLNFAPVDLSQLMEAQQGMLKHLLPARISLTVSAEPGCLATVDSTAIEQMVLNLVTNARDAIAGQGTIHIRVGGTVVDLSAHSWMPAGPYVRLSVADDGAGMDEDTRRRMFEPFFTTKSHGAGTGLGLAMVYGLAKQQGGFVDVQSAPGQGTTVSLFFPRPG